MNKIMSWVGDRLRKAADIYDERNALYGDNYKRFGHIMVVLFPDGITLKTPDDWNRFGVYVQKMAKVTRYAAQWNNGGHEDSLDDDAVYSQMLQELDWEIKDTRIRGWYKQVNDQFTKSMTGGIINQAEISKELMDLKLSIDSGSYNYDKALLRLEKLANDLGGMLI